MLDMHITAVGSLQHGALDQVLFGAVLLVVEGALESSKHTLDEGGVHVVQVEFLPQPPECREYSTLA